MNRQKIKREEPPFSRDSHSGAFSSFRVLEREKREGCDGRKLYSVLYSPALVNHSPYGAISRGRSMQISKERFFRYRSGRAGGALLSAVAV